MRTAEYWHVFLYRFFRTGFIIAFLIPAGAMSANISVYGLKTIGASQELSGTLREHIESNLSRYEQWCVISRTDIDLIMEEVRFRQTGGGTDEDYMITAGNILGIDKIVTGTISKIGNTYNLVLKLIDVQSGRINASSNGRYSGAADGLLDIAESLLKQLFAAEPSHTPCLIEQEPDELEGSPSKELNINGFPDTSLLRKEELYGRTAEEKVTQGTTISPKAAGFGALAVMASVALTMVIYMFLRQ